MLGSVHRKCSAVVRVSLAISEKITCGFCYKGLHFAKKYSSSRTVTKVGGSFHNLELFVH